MKTAKIAKRTNETPLTKNPHVAPLTSAQAKSQAVFNAVFNAKVRKFNFIGWSEGVFLDFDDTLWSKSSIYTLYVPLGPKKDATVKVVRIKSW